MIFRPACTLATLAIMGLAAPAAAQSEPPAPEPAAESPDPATEPDAAPPSEPAEAEPVAEREVQQAPITKRKTESTRARRSQARKREVIALETSDPGADADASPKTWWARQHASVELGMRLAVIQGEGFDP